MADNSETPAAAAAEASQAPSAAAPAQTQDQDINPWSVEGAQDADGNVAAINYDAIVEYVPAVLFALHPSPFTILFYLRISSFVRQ